MPDGDVTIEVRGAEQLADVGRRLKAAGAGKLRRRLLQDIRKSVMPTLPKIRASALAKLPHRGGLAARIAAKPIAVQTRLQGRSASVRIVSRGPGRLRDVNAGRLRHPVFGNRKVWVDQSVPDGYFDEPIERDLTRIRGGVEQAMRATARDIENG